MDIYSWKQSRKICWNFFDFIARLNVIWGNIKYITLFPYMLHNTESCCKNFGIREQTKTPTNGHFLDLTSSYCDFIDFIYWGHVIFEIYNVVSRIILSTIYIVNNKIINYPPKYLAINFLSSIGCLRYWLNYDIYHQWPYILITHCLQHVNSDKYP